MRLTNETEVDKIYPGKRIGELTVKWKIKGKSDSIWKCQCDCGIYCYVKELGLVNKIVENCGSTKHDDLRKI